MILAASLRQFRALFACALLAYLLAAAVAPTPAHTVIASVVAPGGLPLVPTLEPPLGGSGPAIIVSDPLDDCVVELELSEIEIPDPIRRSDISSCTPVHPLSPTTSQATGLAVVSQQLAAVNGYLTKGVGRAFSDCNEQVSSVEAISDGLVVEMSANNPDSIVEVSSSPLGSVAAFSSGISYGQQMIWFRCESLSTEVQVYESASQEAGFVVTPPITTGFMLTTPLGGGGLTTARAAVVAGGLRIADLSHDSDNTNDSTTASFERTRVSAGQTNSVMAQGNFYGPPFQSAGMGFIRRFRPKTYTSLFCDASNFIIVSW